MNQAIVPLWIDLAPTHIPPVIHQVWVGPSEPPVWVQRAWDNWERELELPYLRTIGLTMKIWRNSDVRDHPVLSRTAHLANAKGISPRGLSNLLRVQIIGLYGGMYIDVDCLPLSSAYDQPVPLPELFGTRPSWIACAPNARNQLQMENSCFAFAPGHPFLANVLAHGADTIRRGKVKADFFLGGSRSFRWVYDRYTFSNLEVRWDYTTAGYADLRKALYDLNSPDSTTDRDALLTRYGPFPIAHVWKPRILSVTPLRRASALINTSVSREATS